MYNQNSKLRVFNTVTKKEHISHFRVRNKPTAARYLEKKYVKNTSVMLNFDTYCEVSSQEFSMYSNGDN